MPQQTFLNLSPQRQQEIIDTCLDEFVRYDYRDASLTRIIETLGLAKGSFYRYFASKRELYEYLIEYATGYTLNIFDRFFTGKTDDLLQTWVEFFLACVEQDNDYPLMSYFGYRITRETDNVVLGDVPRQTLKRGIEVLSRHLREQQEQGAIRTDVDAGQLVYVLLQVQSGFLNYLELKYALDFEANVRAGQPLFPLPTETLRCELEALADILRCGFSSPTPGEKGGAG